MGNRNILKIFFCCIFIFYSLNAMARTFSNKETKNVVNILTWWGYLNFPEIVQSAEKACNAKISFDEYYSNDEFIRRWKSQQWNYDVIIFSNTIYNLVKNDVKTNKKNQLWKQAYKYHPIIRNKYFENHYPSNVVFFVHSLTGFLYNPKNIFLTEKDTIFEMFHKAKTNLVVIMDDASEARKLLSIGFENKETNYSDVFSKIDLKKLTQDSKIYIGNGFKNIYKQSNFSFAYVWSGDAMNREKENNGKYQFLIHPRLSYISTDLLAQVSQDKSAHCVAKYLTSKKAMTILQNKKYYFSSYADLSVIKNAEFIPIYKIFLLNLPYLEWLDSVEVKDFYKINQSWQLIKLRMTEKII